MLNISCLWCATVPWLYSTSPGTIQQVFPLSCHSYPPPPAGFCPKPVSSLHFRNLASVYAKNYSVINFYGSATNHLEVDIWAGRLVGFNTNFKTSVLCLNDQANYCLIHFSSYIIYGTRSHIAEPYSCLQFSKVDSHTKSDLKTL